MMTEPRVEGLVNTVEELHGKELFHAALNLQTYREYRDFQLQQMEGAEEEDRELLQRIELCFWLSEYIQRRSFDGVWGNDLCSSLRRENWEILVFTQDRFIKEIEVRYKRIFIIETLYTREDTPRDIRKDIKENAVIYVDIPSQYIQLLNNLENSRISYGTYTFGDALLPLPGEEPEVERGAVVEEVVPVVVEEGQAALRDEVAKLGGLTLVPKEEPEAGVEVVEEEVPAAVKEQSTLREEIAEIVEEFELSGFNQNRSVMGGVYALQEQAETGNVAAITEEMRGIQRRALDVLAFIDQIPESGIDEVRGLVRLLLRHSEIVLHDDKRFSQTLSILQEGISDIAHGNREQREKEERECIEYVDNSLDQLILKAKKKGGNVSEIVEYQRWAEKRKETWYKSKLTFEFQFKQLEERLQQSAEHYFSWVINCVISNPFLEEVDCIAIESQRETLLAGNYDDLLAFLKPFNEKIKGELENRREVLLKDPFISLEDHESLATASRYEMRNDPMFFPAILERRRENIYQVQERRYRRNVDNTVTELVREIERKGMQTRMSLLLSEFLGDVVQGQLEERGQRNKSYLAWMARAKRRWYDDQNLFSGQVAVLRQRLEEMSVEHFNVLIDRVLANRAFLDPGDVEAIGDNREALLVGSSNDLAVFLAPFEARIQDRTEAKKEELLQDSFVLDEDRRTLEALDIQKQETRINYHSLFARIIGRRNEYMREHREYVDQFIDELLREIQRKGMVTRMSVWIRRRLADSKGQEEQKSTVWIRGRKEAWCKDTELFNNETQLLRTQLETFSLEVFNAFIDGVLSNRSLLCDEDIQAIESQRETLLAGSADYLNSFLVPFEAKIEKKAESARDKLLRNSLVFDEDRNLLEHAFDSTESRQPIRNYSELVSSILQRRNRKKEKLNALECLLPYLDETTRSLVEEFLIKESPSRSQKKSLRPSESLAVFNEEVSALESNIYNEEYLERCNVFERLVKLGLVPASTLHLAKASLLDSESFYSYIPRGVYEKALSAIESEKRILREACQVFSLDELRSQDIRTRIFDKISQESLSDEQRRILLNYGVDCQSNYEEFCHHIFPIIIDIYSEAEEREMVIYTDKKTGEAVQVWKCKVKEGEIADGYIQVERIIMRPSKSGGIKQSSLKYLICEEDASTELHRDLVLDAVLEIREAA